MVALTRDRTDTASTRSRSRTVSSPPAARCQIVKYSHDDHAGFVAKVDGNFDAFIVRINPGQLSQGTAPGTQERFDALMNAQIAKGKLVWSSPKVQTQMGAKDALCKIANLGCGLVDTFAYYTPAELDDGFKSAARISRA